MTTGLRIGKLVFGLYLGHINKKREAHSLPASRFQGVLEVAQLIETSNFELHADMYYALLPYDKLFPMP